MLPRVILYLGWKFITLPNVIDILIYYPGRNEGDFKDNSNFENKK